MGSSLFVHVRVRLCVFSQLFTRTDEDFEHGA